VVHDPRGALSAALRQPVRGSGRTIEPALTWGISVYLTDFRTPGLRTSQLYLNVTKAWTMGDFHSGFDMAGLSVTWKK
jgi:hypothetical protein